MKKKLLKPLSVIMAVIMTILALPVQTFASEFQAGSVVTSAMLGDYIGYDGQMYKDKQGYSYISYDGINKHSVGTHSASSHAVLGVYKNGKYFPSICIEAGKSYDKSVSYVGESSDNSAYLDYLPDNALRMLKYAMLCGYNCSLFGDDFDGFTMAEFETEFEKKSGSLSPVANTNLYDYLFATQVIVWEIQQQLRTGYGYGDLKTNSAGTPAKVFYEQLQGRPAELCYKYILDKMASYSTVPSFTVTNKNYAPTHTMKYSGGKYSITLTDTNKSNMPVSAFKIDGVTVTKSGYNYTFTTSSKITTAKQLTYIANRVSGDALVVWKQNSDDPDLQTMASGIDDPVQFYANFVTENSGTAEIKKVWSSTPAYSKNEIAEFEKTTYFRIQNSNGQYVVVNGTVELFDVSVNNTQVEENLQAIEMLVNEIGIDNLYVPVDKLLQTTLFTYFEGFFELPVNSDNLKQNGIATPFGYEQWYHDNGIFKSYDRYADLTIGMQEYTHYLGERPGVIKSGEHGLFSWQDSDEIDLNAVAKEVSHHKGNVWTHVVSLRREDAEKVGYAYKDNSQTADAWKALVRRHIQDIAKYSKIDVKNIKWYAAVHDKEVNPHVHIMVYSTDVTEGFLTERGIEKLKSAFANDIYSEELNLLNENQTELRNILRKTSVEVMTEVKSKLENGTLFAQDKLQADIFKLKGQMREYKGKKLYKFLQPEIKQTVDDIASIIASNPDIDKLYKLWCQCQAERISIYTSANPSFPELVDNPEFKTIKNNIIKVVSEISDITYNPMTSSFTDTPDYNVLIDDFSDTAEICNDDLFLKTAEPSEESIYLGWSEEYKKAKETLYKSSSNYDARMSALNVLETENEKGNIVATFELAKLFKKSNKELSDTLYQKCFDGFLTIYNNKQYPKFNSYLQYRIGKLYESGSGVELNYSEAIKWLQQSANEGNQFAQFAIGNMYYYGNGLEQNYEAAFQYYRQSVQKGVPFAAYMLGQMYRCGTGTEADEQLAQSHYKKAFEFFNRASRDTTDDNLIYRLATMYHCGYGTEKNIEKAIELYKSAMQLGNINAQCSYAEELISGEHIAKDVEAGIELLKNCKNNIRALYRLGVLFSDGNELSPDYESAKMYFKDAIKNTNNGMKFLALYQLGKIYEKENNIEEMMNCYTMVSNSKSAVQNHAEYKLGIIYLYGKYGIKSNIEKAMMLLEHSAEQGNEYAISAIENYNSSGNDSTINAAISLFGQLTRLMSDDSAVDTSIFVKHNFESEEMLKILQKKQAQGLKID